MSSTEASLSSRESVCEYLRTWHDCDDPTADAYALHRAMRATCPVGHSERFGGFYLLARYEDIHAVLRDPVTFSSVETRIPPVDFSWGKPIPLNIDPPSHTAYRNGFAAWFSPKFVADAESWMRQEAESLVAAYLEGEDREFIKHFCIPFPSRVFARLLGVPAEDIEKLLIWKDAMTRGAVTGDPAKIEHHENSVKPAVFDHFSNLIRERRALRDRPTDILSGLIEAEIGGKPLTDDEILRTVTLFFHAGLDTVTATLSLIMWFLATSPRHRQALIDDPALIPNAVEEFLRYFSVVTVSRVVTCEAEIGGVVMHPGDRVMMFTQSAGRDEGQYREPEEVDFRRLNIRHLAFGSGPHRCLGAHIARAELRIALSTIHQMMPRYRVADGIAPVRHFGRIFGIDELCLAID